MLNLFTILLLGGSCAPERDFERNLSSITRPYTFSIARWELNAIFHEIKEAVSDKHDETDDETSKVDEYFSTCKRIKALKSEINAISAGDRQGSLSSLEAELSGLQQQNAASMQTVERVLERQVREALSQQNIFNPAERFLRLKIGFPPVNFKLEKPPHLLVISPRDRIENVRSILLRHDISLKEIESIEAEADKLGVSSLVVDLGGLSLYPNVVTSEADLRFTIDAAVEEWLHQYLAFKPLGFQYLLYLSSLHRNYEIAVMNETLAGMVSREIGSIICDKYYSGGENSNPQTEAKGPGFDFDREMNEIRKQVDEKLVRGEVEQAEQFMEQKQQYLASNGYYIRKLNQAYFAFHGTYSDRPAFSGPIGVAMKKLRSQSSSLKDFLETVAKLTSRQALEEKTK